jgi:uncharacterized phiE125 gp8 family phage protein
MRNASDQLLVAPLAEPIHLDEAKTRIRALNGSSEDADIKRAIASARRYVETYCRRALVRQQRRYVLDCFPPCIEMPVGPLRAVQSIQYVDNQGATQTLAASEYRVDKVSERARITPEWAKVWPSTLYVSNAVIITYTAGHAVPIASVDQAADTVTAKGHDLAADDPVRLSNSGGGLPGGLSADENYYAVAPTTDTLRLALSAGGAAVDITAGAGTGQSFVGVIPDDMVLAMLLLVGHFYANREATVESAVPPQELPLGVEALLAPYRLIRF